MNNNKENIINNIPEFPNDYKPSFDISILSNNIPNNIITYFNTILYSLEISFNYIEKNYRIKCEKYLKLNEEKILFYFDYIQILIKSKILSKNISNAFIIYIRNSITNKKNNLNKEILIKLIKIIIDCIIDLNFPEYCLKEMNKCFEESINSELFEKNGDYLIELLNLFENKIFNKNNNNNIINVSYKGLAYIYENILCSLGVNKNNSENIIKIILNCTDLMINDNINKIKNNNNFNIINENFFDEIKVIYSLLLNISFHLQKTFDNFYLFKEILFTKFLNYGLNFLYLNVNNNNYIKNELKMKTKIFRFLISLIKKNIENNQIYINILKNFITYSINYFNDNNNFKNCFFILFNNDLNDINNNNNSDTINIILNKFIQQILYFLSIILYNEFFYFNYKLIDFINFAKKIIFPFFISNQKEINDISNDNDGTNYANYIYDIILERKNKCLKCALAKFVYIGCKKNENYLNFYLIYSIELIEYSINNNIKNVYDNNNSFISKDDFLLNNNEIKTENRIEIGLIILCIICKVIEKKENKNYYIEILLNFTKNFCNNINNMANKFIIIKERICLYFSIYLDLFIDYISNNNNNKNNNELLINISDFLFINIFNEKNNNNNNNLIGIYESYEAIKKIIINKNINNNNNIILYSISSKYSILFIKFIPSSNFPLFFEVLTYISKFINDNNILLSLLNSLFNRIIKEISPRRLSHDKEGNNNMNNSYKIIINNCFNVIREIFYKKTFIQNYFNEIEKFILPLLKYMKYPTKIEFDEDIILIITIIIKTINFLPKIFFNIFPELYLYLKKNGGMTLDLYELINLYIININNPNNNYNNDDNNLNIDNNKILFKLFKKSLAKNIKQINSPYLSSLLIQIWLIYISNIPNNTIINIISFSLKNIKNILLNEKSNHSETNSNNLNNKLILFSLINIIFCGFINFPIIVINNIEIEVIIKSLNLISSFDVVSVYQIKIIIICICYVLKNKNIMENFNEFGIVLLNVSFKLLKKIKNYEVKNLKKKEINEIKNNFIENEDDDFDNDDDSMKNVNENDNNEDLILNFYEENYKSQSYNNDEIIINNNNNNNDLNNENIIEEINEIDYRTINNKIKEIDEFKLFKESIEILNKENNSLFSNWFNKLSEKNQKDFKDIIYTTYIEISTNENNNNNNINVPRRIVKIKNNKNN